MPQFNIVDDLYSDVPSISVLRAADVVLLNVHAGFMAHVNVDGRCCPGLLTYIAIVVYTINHIGGIGCRTMTRNVLI